MVPGNVDEGAAVEEEQEEEPPNVLNGMSDGPRHPPYRTGSEPLPLPSRWEGLVDQPIVFTRSKHVVVISDSQLWNRTRVQSFFPERAAVMACGGVFLFSPVILTGMPRLPFFPENWVRGEMEPRHHWPEQGNRLRWVT